MSLDPKPFISYGLLRGEPRFEWAVGPGVDHPASGRGDGDRDKDMGGV